MRLCSSASDVQQNTSMILEHIALCRFFSVWGFLGGLLLEVVGAGNGPHEREPSLFLFFTGNLCHMQLRLLAYFSIWWFQILVAWQSYTKPMIIHNQVLRKGRLVPSSHMPPEHWFRICAICCVYCYVRPSSKYQWISIAPPVPLCFRTVALTSTMGMCTPYSRFPSHTKVLWRYTQISTFPLSTWSTSDRPLIYSLLCHATIP